MSKKDIGKILTTGSAKQRLLLYFENIARVNSGHSELLTDSEANQIANSFKKPNEIKLWNKWIRLDRTVSIATMNLQGLKFEVLMHFSNLRGYIMLWNAIENSESLANTILHEIKDTKERDRVAKIGAKSGHILLSRNTVDEEGYLDIKIDYESRVWKDENGKIDLKSEKTTKEINLWSLMNKVKDQAINSATKYISWSKAIEDFMEDEGFNIKIYKEAIDKMREDIYRPIIGWDKYLSSESSFINGFPKRADKIKSKYSIAPDISQLEVDNDIYNYYKREYLGVGDE